MRHTVLHGTSFVVALCCMGIANAADPTPPGTPPVNVDLLEQKVESMSKELDELKAQFRQLKTQGAGPGAAQAQTPGASPDTAQIKPTAESSPPTDGSSYADCSRKPFRPPDFRVGTRSACGATVRSTTRAPPRTRRRRRPIWRAPYSASAISSTRRPASIPNSKWSTRSASADDVGEMEVEQFYRRSRFQQDLVGSSRACSSCP